MDTVLEFNGTVCLIYGTISWDFLTNECSNNGITVSIISLTTHKSPHTHHATSATLCLHMLNKSDFIGVALGSSFHGREIFNSRPIFCQRCFFVPSVLPQFVRRQLKSIVDRLSRPALQRGSWRIRSASFICKRGLANLLDMICRTQWLYLSDCLC